MARVETVIATPPAARNDASVLNPPLYLRPGEIELNPLLHGARPEPLPASEEKSLARLASSMREIGQIIPLIVERAGNDRHILVDGARRLAAALTLDSDDRPFYLECVLRKSNDPLQLAIRANLDRQGYTALQIAYLCRDLRARRGWKGTKEVAQYLGRSRAYVSQHDKILSKPSGMPQDQYDLLLQKIGSGRMGADAAFYALAHVDWKAPRAQEVLQKASEQAEARTSAPASQESQEAAIPSLSKDEIAKLKADTAPTQTKKQVQSRIEKRDVRAAAQAAGVTKGKTYKTLAEVATLLDAMKSSSYPDALRNFASLFEVWMQGETGTREVLSHWAQIAMLVEEAKEKHDRQRAKSKPAKQATAKSKKK